MGSIQRRLTNLRNRITASRAAAFFRRGRGAGASGGAGGSGSSGG